MMYGSGDFTIEGATDSDLSAVWDLVSGAIQSMLERKIFQWDEVYPTRSDFAEDIAAGTLFVLTTEGRLVGCVALDTEQPPQYQDIEWADRGQSLVVHRLTVHPQFQGKGHAGRLVRFAEAYARSNGYSSIRLDAFTEHPAACRLYERLGYQNLGVVKLRKGPFYCFEKILGASES